MADLDHVMLNMSEHEDPAAAQNPMDSLATPPEQPSSHGKLFEDQKDALDIHNQVLFSTTSHLLLSSTSYRTPRPTGLLAQQLCVYPGPLPQPPQQVYPLTLVFHLPARNDADKISGHPRGDLVGEDKLADNATAYIWHLAAANQGLKHSDGKNRPSPGENLAWRRQA
ncbi:MAG: hypothetical protein Q9185_007130 [Variospora sp. 1 TL-2023]